MYTHLVYSCILLIQLLIVVTLNNYHNSSLKVINSLFAEERTARRILEDNITSQIEQMSVSFDTTVRKSMTRIRREIEFNVDVLEVVNEIIKDKLEEAE